ncbi:MAG TPA: hypothetical protein VGD40_19910 [Chryseosolibacter sp.]
MGKKKKNQKINVLSNINVTVPPGKSSPWVVAFMTTLLSSIIGVIYLLIQLLAKGVT